MKYVLVTGAAGGMGQATARTLRDAGYGVFALDKVLCQRDDGIIPVQADVTDAVSLENAFTHVSHITDSLVAIIHLAGIYALDSLVEVSEESLTRVFEINVFGVYRINKTFLPLLKPGSRILITTSELAPLDPLPFTGIYAVSKGCLDKYAYSLRMEVQLLGIHVSVLRPGAVQTEMLGISTSALERFCNTTQLYSCNAKRFRQIVERVEARHVPPVRIAKKICKVLDSRCPRYVYTINRNPLLLLLNILPWRLQTWIIRKILK